MRPIGFVATARVRRQFLGVSVIHMRARELKRRFIFRRTNRSHRLSASTGELGSFIDGQRCVVDVALHVRRGQQGDHLPSDVTNDFAEHNHSVSGDIPPDFTALADDHLGAGHITLKLAIDLDLVLTDDLHMLACNPQVILDHHFAAPIIHGAYPYFGEQTISARDQRVMRAVNRALHDFACGKSVEEPEFHLHRG